MTLNGGDTMNYDTTTCPVPSSFKYRKVLNAGKPHHEKYDDFSVKHPAMPLSKRAKIFAPFDALKGFNEAVAAKDIHYEKKRTLSEEDQGRLNLILNTLKTLTSNSKKARENNILATITYYVPCEDPDNEAYHVKGIYEEKTGTVYKVDSEIYRTIQIDDYLIPIEDIINIESEKAEEIIQKPV